MRERQEHSCRHLLPGCLLSSTRGPHSGWSSAAPWHSPPRRSSAGNRASYVRRSTCGADASWASWLLCQITRSDRARRRFSEHCITCLWPSSSNLLHVDRNIYAKVRVQVPEGARYAQHAMWHRGNRRKSHPAVRHRKAMTRPLSSRNRCVV